MKMHIKMHTVATYTVIPYVTLDHKTSNKGIFFKIEIYTSSDVYMLSIDVWLVWIEQYLAEI